MPVIEASKGTSSWKNGTGKEGYCTFEKPKDLLNDKKWEDAFRPNPK